MNRVAKPIIIFDFDGVVHSYKSGWKGAAIIPDPEVEGIREAIEEIRKEFQVVIVSSRCYQEGGIEAIKKFLADNNIVVDDVTHEKPPAFLTIDDRCICFDGDSKSLLSKIKAFKPWHRKDV
jgi:hypothetical protein